MFENNIESVYGHLRIQEDPFKTTRAFTRSSVKKLKGVCRSRKELLYNVENDHLSRVFALHPGMGVTIRYCFFSNKDRDYSENHD